MTTAQSGSVIIDLAGLEPDAVEKEMLQHPQVAGLILFSRNFYECQQLVALTRVVREANPELLICVDQEGGRVQRFRDGFTRIPCMQHFGNLQNSDPDKADTLAADCAWLLASELRACDVDLSFAPVLDLDTDRSRVIGDRAFGDDPESVVKIARCFVRGLHEAGMPATGKHFPGHGGVVEDSHNEIVSDGRELNELELRDLSVFAKLADELDALMAAHVVYTNIDDAPVGFSSFWLRRYLRQTLNYQGLVFSDDLSMHGASGVGDIDARAHCALSAGCDIVLICNQPDAAARALEALERSGQRSTEAVERFRKTINRHDRIDPQALRQTPRWRNTRAYLDSVV